MNLTSRSSLPAIVLLMPLALAACSQPAVVAEKPQPEPVTAALVEYQWQWYQTVSNDDSFWQPMSGEKFTLHFQADGSLQMRLDCNRGQTSYQADEHNLRINMPMAATMRLCPPGEPTKVYLQHLSEVVSWYRFQDKLILGLPYDSGSMIFTPIEAPPTSEPQ